MGKPGIPTQSFLGELSWSGRAYVESSDVLDRIHVNKRQQDIRTSESHRLGGVTALSENGESLQRLGGIAAISEYDSSGVGVITWEITFISISLSLDQIRRHLKKFNNFPLTFVGLHCKDTIPKTENKHYQKRIARPQSQFPHSCVCD
jgi:hypothetical protein